MNVEWSNRPENSRALPIGQLPQILTIISWGVGLAVLLYTSWTPIPTWVRYIIIGFIGLSCVISLVLGIIPASRLLKSWRDSVKKSRQQQRSLLQLAEIVQEAGTLLDPHLNYSLRCFVDSRRNALVQNQHLHSQIERLSERLRILSNWHGSLVTCAEAGCKRELLFEMRVRDITMFYRDLADVIRELAHAKLHDEDSTRTYDDQWRMVKDKYNQHVGRLEQVLVSIGEFSSGIQTGGFYRF